MRAVSARAGMPLGIVIKDGKLLNGGLSSAQPIVGFDQNNQLVVGTMTGQECLDRGIRDAVSFGPTFIVNGKAMRSAGRAADSIPAPSWDSGPMALCSCWS